MGVLPWTLADFPQDYILLLHISPGRTRPSKPRRDFYLYGARLIPSTFFFFRSRIIFMSCTDLQSYVCICDDDDDYEQARRTSQVLPHLLNLSSTPSG